jgi:Fur family ferric uptake transcriptional regulator
MGILRKTKSVKILLDEFERHATAISAITLIDE